jgi:DNA-binding MarR family transcriptional regulator
VPRQRLTSLLERVVLAGVGLTTRALSEATPGVDLTLQQWRVLVVLGEAPGGMTVSRVATRIGVTVPATSRQLRRLERRGLVAIGADATDRRASRAALTVTGCAVRDAILHYRRERLSSTTRRVDASDRTLAELARIAALLDEYA